jgi:23S rRNA (guanosine2251-2'-O)-methyltransferase
MLISGKNAVKETLLSDATAEKLSVQKGVFEREVSEIISLARGKGAKVAFLNKEVLDKLSGGKKHQGVILETTEFKYAELAEVLNCAKERGEEPLIVILDGVQDPMNLGAVVRSAECLGAHGVIIAKRGGALMTEAAVRASAGAAAHLPVVKANNINDAIRELKERFIKIYTADLDGKPLYSADFKRGCAIVAGGEGEGVKRLTRELSDEIVTIPQSGKVSSLNASVAAGIALYEAARQRRS